MSKNHREYGAAVVPGWSGTKSVSWPLRILQTQVPQGPRDIENPRNTPSRAEGPGADIGFYMSLNVGINITKECAHSYN